MKRGRLDIMLGGRQNSLLTILVDSTFGVVLNTNLSIQNRALVFHILLL